MKNLKFAVLVMALFLGSQVFAGNSDPNSDNSKAIATEIDHLLKDHEFKLDQDLLVNVSFTVNKENELVVLSVDTKNYGVKQFIMKRLNYKKLNSEFHESMPEYIVPVRIQA